MPYIIRNITRVLILCPLFFFALIQPSFADHEHDKQVWRLESNVESKELLAGATLSPLAEFGRLLMFDPRLSKSGARACVSCHNPVLAWSDALPNAMGGRFALGRNTPSLFNISDDGVCFWDGRVSQLKAAIKQHILSPNIMDGGAPSHLQSIEGYAARFTAIYGEIRLSLEHISEAISYYLASIKQEKTAFDRWIEGEESAISEDAKVGFTIFKGKGGCVKCHTQPTFTDRKFHNIGLNSIDPGRFEVTNLAKDRNSFRTPPLRQVSRTAPYMHDGSLATLEEVIAFYNRGGDRKQLRNPLESLHLSRKEELQLVAFLKSLTSPPADIVIPRLPVSGELLPYREALPALRQEE